MPEFVLLGGLVPDLLCSQSSTLHVGTTDVDVQVNLEIAGGSVNASRLEAALRSARFVPDLERVWRWRDRGTPGLVVKAEFLADLDDIPNQATVTFDGCQQLGAVNLRGTWFATRDWQLRPLAAPGPGRDIHVELRVARLAGYLLAKTHAAHRRRAIKDWYDLAYVLIHNDAGGPLEAAEAVIDRFANDLGGETSTALEDLASNFSSSDAQGPQAYADTMLDLHSEHDWDLLTNDAVTAVATFMAGLKDRENSTSGQS
ncbi:MAG TPA: nucleotidyl transferase AbiEii/AbiGii toxin family protein [Acidimicrobiales bacterium]|nr:nucleotidyl transferase AbiEii/AbiGii toxin family protein [Acidimicrobiales bacterium]